MTAGNLPDLVPVVAPAVGLLVGLFVALAGRRGAIRRLLKVEAAFEPASSHFSGFPVPSLWGRSSGYLWKYRLRAKTNNSPGGAVLETRVSTHMDWKAVEIGHGPQLINMGGLLAVQLGFLQDIEIGDADLDRRLRFSASNAVHLKSAFDSESVRRAMLALAESPNFRAVSVHKGRCSVRWAPRNPELDEDVDSVRTRLRGVVDLLTALGHSPGALM